jgi:hypothetical protein
LFLAQQLGGGENIGVDFQPDDIALIQIGHKKSRIQAVGCQRNAS